MSVLTPLGTGTYIRRIGAGEVEVLLDSGEVMVFPADDIVWLD